MIELTNTDKDILAYSKKKAVEYFKVTYKFEVERIEKDVDRVVVDILDEFDKIHRVIFYRLEIEDIDSLLDNMISLIQDRLTEEYNKEFKLIMQQRQEEDEAAYRQAIDDYNAAKKQEAK